MHMQLLLLAVSQPPCPRRFHCAGSTSSSDAKQRKLCSCNAYDGFDFFSHCCCCVLLPVDRLQFKLSFPFRSAQQVVQGSGAGASYLLTYLDEDMLIGRGPQGTFIFSRVADDAVAAAAADSEWLTL